MNLVQHLERKRSEECEKYLHAQQNVPAAVTKNKKEPVKKHLIGNQ